ncbi:MAG: tetratricopeptide repeat protein [Methylobacter sp.]
MQFSFTGRASELQHVDNLIKAKQGALFAVSGKPGIGKSTLLRQLATVHADKSQAFIDLNDVPPLQTAVEFLQYLAKHAQGLSHTEKALAKINGSYKSTAELLAPYQSLLLDSAQLALKEHGADLTDAETGKLTALVKTLWQLGGVLSKKRQESVKAALGDPELLLLKALQADCKKQPLIFIDTYERLQAAQELSQQKITCLYSQPKHHLMTANATLSMQDWLDRLLEFLQKNGAIVVVAGRRTGHRLAQELPRFSDEDICNIVGSSDYADLQALLTETDSRSALLSLLKRLSFDGIPLWLQLALNFISLELANGADILDLAAKPDIQALFATPEIGSDLSSANIDHANCKLALFKRVMQHNLELENEAWKMALPRRLNQEVLTLIFAEQADAMRDAFAKAGLMPSLRWTAKTSVMLHEEIRDLLLAYSRYKGWHETEATKALHQQLAGLFERRYQAGRNISYMLERLYHALMSEDNADLEAVKEPEMLEDMAANLYAEKQYAKMVQVLLRLIAIQSDHQYAWNNLGVALSALGKPDEVEAACRRQIEIKPDHEYAWNGLGNALSALGKPDEAEAAYRRQLETEPDHEQAWNGLGNALRALGQPDEAEAACRRQIEIKPDHEHAWNGLGNALRALGQPDEAEAAYRRQIEIKPDHKLAWYGLGNALRALGKPDQAEVAYHRQVEINPDHQYAWNGLGIVCWKQGRLEQAQQAFAQALKLNPQDLSALSNDAELALVQNDKSRCLQRIDSAAALLDNKIQEYAILPFLAWLAELETPPDTFYQALEQLDGSVKIDWDFTDTEPAILRLTDEQQSVARQFMADLQGRAALLGSSD